MVQSTAQESGTCLAGSSGQTQEPPHRRWRLTSSGEVHAGLLATREVHLLAFPRSSQPPIDSNAPQYCPIFPTVSPWTSDSRVIRQPLAAPSSRRSANLQVVLCRNYQLVQS